MLAAARVEAGLAGLDQRANQRHCSEQAMLRQRAVIVAEEEAELLQPRFGAAGVQLLQFCLVAELIPALLCA